MSFPYSYKNIEEFVDFSSLEGKTLSSVEVGRLKDDNDCILFQTEGGERYLMYHEQDCCETVEIENIDGDLQSLVGQVIDSACKSSIPRLEGGRKCGCDYSRLWTFYHINGVCIRCYGTSEEVSFVRLKKEGEV